MTARDARPSKTRAVVVAIEHYGLTGEDLDGPAADAVRFIDWLGRRGVSGGQVTLLASPLEANGTSLEATGVPSRPATRQAIYDLFVDELPKSSGDLLWLYWSGHGLMDSAGGRRLLTADAHDIDPVNIDLDSLLTYLHSDYNAGWPQQVAVIDACAAHATTLPAPQAFPLQRFESVTRQFVIFGAGPGEVAVNQGVRKSGMFSEAFLKALEASPTDRFPPDLKAISKGLVGDFTALRARGQARQTPVTYQETGWDASVRQFSDVEPQSAVAPPGPPEVAPVGADAVAFDLKWELAEAFLGCDIIDDPARRHGLFKRLRRAIYRRIRESDQKYDHVLSAIDVCLDFPGGLQELIHLVRVMEGPESLKVAEVLKVARRILGPDANF
jgi:hypothetical protein